MTISSTMGIFLAGCAIGPDYKAPAVSSTTRYASPALSKTTASAPGISGVAQHFTPGARIPAQWWTLFHSAQINELVQEALADSPTLGAAQATLRQARENLDAQKGALLYPSVGASLQGSRQRITPSEGSVGGTGTSTTAGFSGSGPMVLNAVNATVNVAYSPDVFGGVRRTIEGAQAQLDFQRDELEATYLTLTSNVVTTALDDASYRAQLRATLKIAAAQEDALDVLRKQYEVGGISLTSVLQQQSALAATQATIPGLQKEICQLRNQLAVLLGRSPATTSLPRLHLAELTLPSELPLSLPSDLVRQRPDVRASETQLHQASAQIGVATANMLPQFNITAEYGASGPRLAHLFNPTDTLWSLLAGLTQPIFNGGQLSAQRRAAYDAYEVAWQQYRSTVLLAFQDVANTLVSLQSDARTLRADMQADELARKALDITKKQYQLGGVNFLDLLSAEQQYAQAHTTLAQAQAARYVDTATLFQALGGGWWNRRAPLASVAGPEAGQVPFQRQDP